VSAEKNSVEDGKKNPREKKRQASGMRDTREKGGVVELQKKNAQLFARTSA